VSWLDHYDSSMLGLCTMSWHVAMGESWCFKPTMIVSGVSSIRAKQGIFLIFNRGWIWARKVLPSRVFRFGRAGSRPFECWRPGRMAETEAGGGRHRLLTALRIGFAPFAWLTGVTSPRQVAGAEYLEAMVRPGVVLPRSDRGRPVSWLTDPSRRVSTRHPRMSHPVAPSPFCQSRVRFILLEAVGWWEGGVIGAREDQCREVPT